MTRTVLVLAMVCGVVIAAAPATAAPPERHPAVGVWTATDIVDGSDLTLAIRGGNRNKVRVRLFDDVATVACPVDDSPVIATAKGTFVDDVLDVTLKLRCLGEPNPGPIPVSFVYDGGTDTILMGGDTYTRR